MKQCPGAHGEPGPTLAPAGKGVCPECGRVVGLLTTRRLYPHTAIPPQGRITPEGIREYRGVNDRPLPQTHARTLRKVPGGPDPAIEALAHLQSEEALAAIERVLRTLTWREREVVKLRYGIGTAYTYTLDEVARVFGVSRERIRQLEARAVDKMRHPVRAAKLAPFLPPPKPAKAPQSPQEGGGG